MGIKVLPPDVNESIGYFAAVGDDIRFGLGAVRNVGFNVVDADPRRPRGEGRASRRSTTSCARCRCRSRTSAPSSRSSRPARSTRSAPPGARSSRSTRSAVESAVSEKRDEANGQVGFDFDSLLGRGRAAPVDSCPTGPSGPSATSSPSSARCSGCTSPTTRSPGSRCSSRSTRARRSPSCIGVRARRRTANGHDRRARHERAAPRRPADSRQPVRHDPGRGLRRRDHRHVHGQDLPGVRAGPRRATRSSSSAAG